MWMLTTPQRGFFLVYPCCIRLDYYTHSNMPCHVHVTVCMYAGVRLRANHSYHECEFTNCNREANPLHCFGYHYHYRDHDHRPVVCVHPCGFSSLPLSPSPFVFFRFWKRDGNTRVYRLYTLTPRERGSKISRFAAACVRDREAGKSNAPARGQFAYQSIKVKL